MAAVTIRNLPDAMHRTLKLRAAQHGRSAEAEIRAILEDAVCSLVGLSARLTAIGRSLGDFELSPKRDSTALSPALFL